MARWTVTRRPDQLMIDEPGVHGLLPCAEDAQARLLITDDRGYERLRSVLDRANAGMVKVFEGAARCVALMQQRPGWTRSERATAMICADLELTPSFQLPDELILRPVRRLSNESPNGVPLEDAVVAARHADPRITDPPSVFADYLRSLPKVMRLLAAVDPTGVVRATSGFGVFGAAASVFFVNTDPDWRCRGIGQAMTAAALHAAGEHGARHASLDATGTGLRIYERLGFDAVAQTRRFSATLNR